MSDVRTIEIGFELHKAIEAERRSFAETEDEILRRLVLPRSKKTADQAPVAQSPRGRPWRWKGVELPHGTELRMTYNGQVHQGQVLNGKWMVSGKAFTSPSGAAHAVARTKKGRLPSLNGWGLWEVRLPGKNRWMPLSDLMP